MQVAYIIDQCVFGSLFLLFFILFYFQIRAYYGVIQARKDRDRAESSRRSSDGYNATLPAVGTLQYYFHRIGLFTCFLEIGRFVDPYAIHHIYNQAIVVFFTNNTTALVIIAAASAFYLPITLVYRAITENTPLQMSVTYMFIVILTLLVANVVAFLTLFYGAYFWVQAIFLFWLVAVEIIILIFINVGMQRFREAVIEYEGVKSEPSVFSAPPEDAFNNDMFNDGAKNDLEKESSTGRGSASSSNLDPERESLVARVREDRESIDLNDQQQAGSVGRNHSIMAKQPQQPPPQNARRNSTSSSFSTTSFRSSSDGRMRKVLNAMARFQVFAHVIVILALIVQVRLLIVYMRRHHGILEAPTGQDYIGETFFSSTAFVFVQLLGVLLMFWFSYIPLRFACRGKMSIG